MKKLMKILVPILFFGGFIILGCVIYKDYGIPWDESVQTQIGALNFRYLFRSDPSLLSFSDRFYGAVFEVPLLWVSFRFSIPRHLTIFLIFISGLILFYCLSRRLFHNSWLGLLGAILLAISPRIFADAFYNSKDIPFLVAAIATVFTLVVLADALTRDQKWWILAAIVVLHAGASAVFISTRVAGVMILPLTLLLLIIKTIEVPPSWKRILSIFLGYLTLSAGLTILFWPILWRSPWREFVNAFSMMSKYPFGRIVLYEGQYYLPENLPWHYLLVWIGVTTPLIIMAGILPGMIGWTGRILSWTRSNKKIQNLKRNASEISHWSVIIGWAVIPVVAIYLFHSVLYDGWRQMFFIYPAIILIDRKSVV
jgi:hypothetical protein